MPIDRLLRELRDDTYVALRPSGVAGVGVFAIRDIPKGCRTIFSPPTDRDDDYLEVPRAAIEALPAHARHMVETYCLFDDERYYVPKDGFKKMDLVSFLNHSETPNVRSVDDGAYFEALVDIPADAELFVDYGTIVTE
jgi:SET domain-containing protein